MKIRFAFVTVIALVFSVAGCNHLPWRRSQQIENDVAEKWIEQAASEIKYRNPDPETQRSQPMNMAAVPDVEYGRSGNRQTSSGGSCCH